MCTGIEYEYIQCSFNICKAVEHAPETRLRKEIKYIHKTYKRKVRSLNPNPDQPVSDSTIVGQACHSNKDGFQSSLSPCLRPHENPRPRLVPLALSATASGLVATTLPIPADLVMYMAQCAVKSTRKGCGKEAPGGAH